MVDQRRLEEMSAKLAGIEECAETNADTRHEIKKLKLEHAALRRGIRVNSIVILICIIVVRIASL